MNCKILLAGFLVFSICLLLHVAVWRRRYPKNRPAALVLIFIVFPVVLASVGLGLERLSILAGVDNAVGLSLIDLLAVYLLHFSLSSSYILSYPAVEAVSPSLLILLMIGDSRSAGLRYDDMLHCFDDGDLLQPRIQDLIDAGWIVETNGFFRVASRGAGILLFYMFLHRLIGTPKGKG